MTSDRARIFEELIQLDPLCSGALHQQYLTCGKSNCRCRDKKAPQPHGPYFLWTRRINGRQVNRTLRPGAKADMVREGISNFQRAQDLLNQLVRAEEGRILEDEEFTKDIGKKNFKPRSRRH
jgi:hypothetical protein